MSREGKPYNSYNNGGNNKVGGTSGTSTNRRCGMGGVILHRKMMSVVTVRIKMYFIVSGVVRFTFSVSSQIKCVCHKHVLQ